MNFNDPEEMIRANGAAEAAEQERLRQDIVDYQRMLGEMKDLYLKNNELVTQMQDAVRQFTGELPSPDQIEAALAESEKEAADIAHSETTNEGARIVEEKLKVMEEKAAAGENGGGDSVLAAIDAAQQALTELMNTAGEHSHRDSVRVYRNVQASLVSELESQTKTLSASMYALREGQTAIEEELRAVREAAEKTSETVSGRRGGLRTRTTAPQIITLILVILVFVMVAGSTFGFAEPLLRMLGL